MVVLKNSNPRSVAEAFDLFAKKIQLTNEDIKKADAFKVKLFNIFKYNVDKNTQPEYIRVSGSFKRKTAVNPEYDLDMLLVLKKEFAVEMGPTGILYKIKEELEKNNINAKPQVHAVKLLWQGFSVDVVPAFISDQSQQNKGIFNIPEATNYTGKWILTSPKKNEEILNKAKQEYGDIFIKTIRMLKYWNKKDINCKFTSFHLESIIFDIFNNQLEVFISLQEAIQTVFIKLKQYVDKEIPEPANIGPKLKVNNSKKECINRRVSNAIYSARDAVKLESEGKIIEALQTWKNIFGEEFPTINTYNNTNFSNRNFKSSSGNSISNKKIQYKPERRFG